MHRLLVDFNDIDNGSVTGLASDVSGPHPPILHVGDRVRVHDDGEHEAWAVVRDVKDGLISAVLVRSTWGASGHIQVIPGRPTWWIRQDQPVAIGWNQAGPETATDTGKELQVGSM